MSPISQFLVARALQRESGSLALGDQTLHVVRGELSHVSSHNGDHDFTELLVRAGSLSRQQCAQVERRARELQIELTYALESSNLLGASELRSRRRALWLERFGRLIRNYLHTPLADDAWVRPASPADERRAASRDAMPLLPVLLDTLAELAHTLTPQSFDAQRDQLWCWTQPSASADIKRWAGWGELPDRAALSLVLEKRPRSAPQLAALLASGLARLEAPGASVVALRSAAQPVAAVIPPGSVTRDESIPTIARKIWPRRLGPLHDPLRELEYKLEECRAPARRAQLFLGLSNLWEQRLGSLEEAARNDREAAAAQPGDHGLLMRAARACLRIGQAELAVRYAEAALPEAVGGEERTQAQRLLCDLQERLGRTDDAIATLRRAAADFPAAAWPHERLARLAYDAEQQPLGAAHLRAAADLERERTPARALANYALAYSWQPHDTGLADAYADALAALGHPEAALALLTETARAEKPPRRQRLLRAAARRAERHGLMDVAADLLFELLDEPLEATEFVAVLNAYLERPGADAEHAAVLESALHRIPAQAQPAWLARTSEALGRIAAELETSRHYAELAARGEPAPQPSFNDSDLREHLRGTADPDERARWLRQLAARAAYAGDARAVASACLSLLAQDPDDSMAIARLWRATAQLKDPVLCVEALSLLAEVREGRKRARALAQLARHYEQLSDLDAALEHAHAALECDPSAADAALLGLRHVKRLEPQRALRLLALTERTFAGAPLLLFARAEAAAASGELALHQRALRELMRHWPELLQPRMLWLVSWLTTNDSARIAEAAHDLLKRCPSPRVEPVIRDAIRRLSELHDHAAAAQLAEGWLEHCGRLDAALVDKALESARASGRAGLLTRALERAASTHAGSARVNYLCQLADQHAAAGDRAAELRVWLRLLPLPEGRAGALTALTQRYAECGDLQRLLTVLSLRLRDAPDAAARRELWFEMACATVNLGDDPERARAFMRSLLRECLEDRQALLHGLGALLSLGPEAWAFTAARELVAEFEPSLAAQAYLWLAHKAEASADSLAIALDLAVDGALRFPEQGELLLLAERLTLAEADKERALSLYAALIAEACGAHGLRALHYRAGRWLERFGLPQEALEYYRRAAEIAPNARYVALAIERCARAEAEPRRTSSDAHLSEEALRSAADSGDTEALGALVAHVSADDARAEEAFALWAQLVRAAPQRTDALRELRRRALQFGAAAQARVCDQIASLFDPRYPSHTRILFSDDEVESEELWQFVRAGRDPGVARLSSLMWQAVQSLPELRPALAPSGLGQPWMPDALRSTPLARAYTRATVLLDRRDTRVFMHPDLARDVEPVPGPQRTLVVRAELDSQAALEFQLARALIACEPEHALVTALGREAAEHVFTAFKAALLRESHTRAIRREHEKLAASLRAGVPERLRGELAELLATHGDALVYEERKREAELQAVRAGLWVSGDVRTSLECLARSQPELAACDLERETDFQAACRQSDAFAEVLRTALSLPFVGLTGIALEAEASPAAE